MSTYSFGSVGDAFSSLLDAHVQIETAKASNPALTNATGYAELNGARDDITQQVNVEPNAPSTTNVTGANAGVSVGGVEVNGTALMVGGGVLLLAVVLARLAK